MGPLRYFASAIVLFFLPLLAFSTEPNKDVTDCIASIERSLQESKFLEQNPDFTVKKEAGEITLSHHPKEWLIYGSDMIGRWSKEPRKRTGPDNDGLIITIRVIPSSEAAPEQWAGRYHGLSLNGMAKPEESNDHTIHYPYWNCYGCRVLIPAQKVELRVNVEYNRKTDPKLTEAAFTAISSPFKDKTAPLQN